MVLHLDSNTYSNPVIEVNDPCIQGMLLGRSRGS